MDKVSIAIGIQARTSSNRFPGKILEKIWKNETILESVIERAIEFKEQVRKIADVSISLLIPEKQKPEILASFENPRPIDLSIVTGDEANVLSRYEKLFFLKKPTYLMRITGDCPAWSPYLAKELLEGAIQYKADYAHISTPDDYADGLDVELIRGDLFHKLMEWPEKHIGIEEHVTISFKGSMGPKATLVFRLPHNSRYANLPKISIDTREDLDRVKAIREHLWWIPN